MRHDGLVQFIAESNRIEGIFREPTDEEIEAHDRLLSLNTITIDDMTAFVTTICGFKKNPLRDKPGMDVQIGGHLPPRGSSRVVQALSNILEMAHGPAVTPHVVHSEYELLHPYMDGNGRSGRALWAWHMNRIGQNPFALPFLHRWYYDSLSRYRK